MNARLRQIVHYHYHFKVFMVCFITRSCKIKDVLKHFTIKAGKKYGLLIISLLKMYV